MNQYVGQTLGAYQILEQIGKGGMATIFKAYQPSMDRYVAVKVLGSHFTGDESFVARFTQEARTLARLEHLHILPVHDYGEQRGVAYLVMRYVDAGTLKDLITERAPMSSNEAARLLGQVGGALGYAHSQGVIHRDIKPTNVLIDERDDAFLTDFGIAKLMAGTSQFTATGAIVGTPAYMSPEQGLGEPVDHRSDIYALGVVLYEMVTGRVPYEAETPLAVLLKHVNDPLPPPRQVKPDLPESVERVILKALAKSPDDRFQAVGDLVEAFERAVAGLPTEVALPRSPSRPTASPPPAGSSAASRPWPFGLDQGRKTWLSIAGGLAVLAVLLAIVLFVLPNLGGDGAEPTPTQPLALALAPTEGAEEPGDGEALVSPEEERAPPLLVPSATSAPDEAREPSPGEGRLPPGWTSFVNDNFVHALARQGDYLWVGGEGGLVRWHVNRGEYVRFQVADGLASNWVNDLLADEEAGVLWVGTEAGLNRFDGQTWLTVDEVDGLDSPEVETLWLDEAGGLWAGTEGGERGLNDYDGQSWGPPPIPPLPLDAPNVSVLRLNQEAGLLVGLYDHGLAYFDGEDWSLSLDSVDAITGTVYDVLMVDDGQALVSLDERVAYLDLETGDWQEIDQLDDFWVRDIHQARDGGLWFAGDEGVVRYDPETGDWQPVQPAPDWLGERPATCIVEDEGGIWLGTDGAGVFFYDGLRWQPWVIVPPLGANRVWAIRQDGEGGLWFLHDDGNGLSRYDPVEGTWRVFDENQGAMDWPSAVGVDGEGHLWIGGYGGLQWYDGQTWQTVRLDRLDEDTVFGIAFDPNGLWWLRSYAGLSRYDPADDAWRTFTADDHPALESVSQVLVADDGTVWASGSGGLVYYQAGNWVEPDATGDAPDNPHQMALAPDGGVWVAGGDLYQLARGRWRRFRWPDGYADTLAVGPDGMVWVGGGDGLGRFDPSQEAWRTFTPADGLVNPEVNAIYVTPEGAVWAGTGGGVSRYVPEQSGSTAARLVLDNNAPEFSVEAGEWGTCWDGDCGGVSYGDDFRFAAPGCPDCRARFDFRVGQAGEYDVWSWWPQGDDRATDTPFTVEYGGNSQTVIVDQRNDGSRWYLLGTFSFEAGESVSLIVQGSDSGYANADAAALTPAGTGPPPGSVPASAILKAVTWAGDLLGLDF